MAIKKDFISSNPCEKIDILDEKKITKRKIIDDYKTFFKIIWKETELRNYCLLMFYLGFRCGDIMKLNSKNIFEQNWIFCLKIIESKTKKSVTVPIHKSLIENKIILLTNKTFKPLSIRYFKRIFNFFI